MIGFELKKGRLQFDDGATTTFEYPSEKSLAEEIRIEKLAQTSRNAPISSMNGDADEEGNSHSVAMVNNDAGQLSSLPDKNTGPTENRPLSPGMHQLVPVGRLQFDDGATTTFEYPSEKSLAEEIRIEKLAQTSRNVPISSMNGDADEEGNSHSVAMANNDAGQLSSEGLFLCPGCLLAVGLGNYTPSSMGTKFELGVTRAGSMTGQQFSSTSGKSGGKSPPKDEIPESDFVIESEVGEKFTEAGITADLLF
ncbi:unnamed protein product [Notodromas monacha]|uniref:Uncharacterized protein n=1 Tax=Notodromas monacha TaxID=399045 RepID=A0A7R9BNI9_9CRUS|nr:unnamed protein product [Notodromas monacha]CAG0917949.1 unnamed protein product [Notodromas monacha]